MDSITVPEASCKYPNDNGDAIDDEEKMITL